MRQNCLVRCPAGLLALLGACALTAGCHLAINLPPAAPSAEGAPSAPASAAATQSLPVAHSYGGGGAAEDGTIQRCSATTQDPLLNPPAPDPSGGAAAAGGAGHVTWGPDGGPVSPDETLPAPGGPAPGGPVPFGPVPRELDKVSLPDYVVEPPDILLIDTIRGTPLPPYRIEPLDVLQIQVADALPNEPITGLYIVEPEGTVNLGLSYGSVPVGGMTLDQARAAVNAQLRRVLKEPRAIVALAQARGIQQLIRGEHLVRPDGTISLGVYGDVYVAGLNRCQVKNAIERTMAQYLLNPQVSIDILGYNSKVYYLIFDGGGYGQQVYRLPITGNETVLDAIGMVNGLPAVSSRKKIWVARPSPADRGCDQVLPVDWRAVTEGGSTATNYQLLPGDRVYVKADPWICFDNAVAKIMSPFERMLGFTLLTESVIQDVRFNRNNGTGGVLGFVP